MPPDETMAPDPRTPHVEQTVNVAADGAGNGFLGLTGWMKSLAQFSAVVIVFGLGTGVIVWTLQNDRADRREDRELFREAMRNVNDEQNRRTGEVKGSTDKLIDTVRENSAIIRQWIDESRRERLEHGKPLRSAELKPPMPE
jgi:uncharacterized protein HemX